MSTAGGSAFRHRDFALFWVSLVTEALALQMAVVAIGWQVYSISGSALDLGLIGLAEFLPLLLLALPAGHLADRLPRRNLLTVMASSNAVVLAGLLAVTMADTGHVWPFFALAFVQGIGSAIGAPAGRALTPSLVPQEILVSALAQRSIAFQGSAVVGPAIGGILFAIQPELVYVVAIGLAFVGLGCILAMRSGRAPAAEGVVGLDEVLAGVRLIRRTNVLLGAISLDLFAVLLGGAVALLPIFAKGSRPARPRLRTAIAPAAAASSHAPPAARPGLPSPVAFVLFPRSITRVAFAPSQIWPDREPESLRRPPKYFV